MIELAANLALDPAQAATQRYAWIATSGGGKTYGEGRFVEQLHAAHVPVIVVDTVGVWPPLRLAADGKSAGLPFVVIGGLHADLPLDLLRGAELATFLVRQNASAVVDLSFFTSKKRAPFVHSFCEGLLLALNGARRPRMLVFDEAQDIAPQKARKWEQDMVESVSALIRKGRNHLCGVTLLTQRPQSVSKEVLDLANNVFVGMCHGKAVRKAVHDWCETNADDDQVKAQFSQLPSLQPGQFFFWSPSWLRRFELVSILPKWTFDGSSTTRIDPSLQLAELAPVDIVALRQLLAPEPEAAPEDEAEIDRQVATYPDAQTMMNHAEDIADGLREQFEQVDRERQALVDQVDRYEDLFARVEESVANVALELGELQRLLRDAASTRVATEQSAVDSATVRTMAARGLDVRDWSVDELVAGERRSDAEPLRAVAARPRPVAARPAVPAAAGAVKTGGLEKADRTILAVLAWQKEPISKRKLALLAVYAIKGGGFNNALGRLRSSDRIAGTDPIAITLAGRKAIGKVPQPPTGDALFDWWLQNSVIDGCMKAILLALRSAVRGLTKEALAHRAGMLSERKKPYEPGGGGFNNALGRLRTLELIQGVGKLPISLAPELRGRGA